MMGNMISAILFQCKFVIYQVVDMTLQDTIIIILINL